MTPKLPGSGRRWQIRFGNVPLWEEAAAGGPAPAASPPPRRRFAGFDELYLAFHTSFHNEDVKVTEHALIVRTLVRSTGFWMDATACLPLDLIQLAVGWNPLTRLAHIRCNAEALTEK